MDKLKFYDIDKEYIKYLKSYEEKIPDIAYDRRDKFICGVVLNINGMNYFAPVSSFPKQQKTNLLIYNEKGEINGSIRFSFMFPAFDGVVKEKDFSVEGYSYKRLLMSELDYCNSIIDIILLKATKVYEIGTSINHPLKENCCDFLVLEKAMLEYVQAQEIKESEKQVASVIRIA